MVEIKEKRFESLYELALKNRNIFDYQQPYNAKATQFIQCTFHPIVKDCCIQNKVCSADLRASKVCFVGDSGVGKTSIINRFCHNSYNQNYKATIGVDFEVERFTILNVQYKLQIWDTAGQERFRSVASAYYRGAHVLVSVFDVSNPKSLDKAIQWIQEASEQCERPLKFIVGNKIDLINKEDLTFSEEAFIKICNSIGAELWCVSAESGENIANLFCRLTILAFEDTILKNLHRIEENPLKNRTSGLSLNSPPAMSTVNAGNIRQESSHKCYTGCT